MSSLASLGPKKNVGEELENAVLSSEDRRLLVNEWEELTNR